MADTVLAPGSRSAFVHGTHPQSTVLDVDATKEQHFLLAFLEILRQ